jgi:hypothetical protein
MRKPTYGPCPICGVPHGRKMTRDVARWHRVCLMLVPLEQLGPVPVETTAKPKGA